MHLAEPLSRIQLSCIFGKYNIENSGAKNTCIPQSEHLMNRIIRKSNRQWGRPGISLSNEILSL